MSPASCPRKVLASAVLVAVALGTITGASFAQGVLGGAAARDWERRTAQVRHAREELSWRVEREQAHAQMPDTMYASTPDPVPPHPFPLDAGTGTAPERSGSPPGMSARSAMQQTHRIGLFPSAADALGRQGFARIINHSESDGEVEIDAYDDDGKHYGPLTLAIGAGETVHFNSDDLEGGQRRQGARRRHGSAGRW